MVTRTLTALNGDTRVVGGVGAEGRDPADAAVAAAVPTGDSAGLGACCGRSRAGARDGGAALRPAPALSPSPRGGRVAPPARLPGQRDRLGADHQRGDRA